MKVQHKRIASFALAAAMTFSLIPSMVQTVQAEGGTMLESPFASGTMGSQRFRIPALLESRDGEKLYASADIRWGGRGDSPGNLDTMFAVSSNGGQSWTRTMVNHFVDHKDGRNDPSPDRRPSNAEPGSDYLGSLTSASFIDTALVEKGDTLYLLAGAVPAYTGLAGWWNTGAIKDAKGIGYDTEGNLLLYKGTPGQEPSRNESEYTYYADKSAAVTAQNGTKLFPIKERGTEALQNAFIDAEFQLYDQDHQPVMCRQYDGDVNLTSEQVHCNVFYAQSEWKVFPTWHLWLRTSQDQGAHWSEPTILNHMVKKPGEGFLGVAPGRGHVTPNGRIIFPVYDNSTGTEYASVIYSDDDGATWHRGERADSVAYGQKSSESQIIQLDDTTLRMFSRGAKDNTPIYYADSTNGGRTWGAYQRTSLNYDGQCMTSFIRLNDFTYEDKPVVVGALPEQSRRHHGAIRMGYIDQGDITWLDDKIQVTSSSQSQSFAYSCLADLGNGEVALLYESNEPMGIIELERFDLKPYLLKNSVCVDGKLLAKGENGSYSLELRQNPYTMTLYGGNGTVRWSLDPADDDKASVTEDGMLTTKATGKITLTADRDNGENFSFTIEIMEKTYPLIVNLGQSTIKFQSGVDDPVNPTKVKPSEAVTFQVTANQDYKVDAVQYRVGAGENITIPLTDDTYTIAENIVNDKLTITVVTSKIVPDGGSGGGSSGGGSSSGGDYRPTPKPEINHNPDGSTTETIKKTDGTVIKTTTKLDGSTTIVETKPDGTVSTTDKDKEGNVIKTVKRTDGSITTTENRKDGTKVETNTDKDGSTTAVVKPGKLGTDTTVTIPTPDQPAPGDVIIIEKTDGTEEVIPNTVRGKNGLIFSTDRNVTIKVENRGKVFADVPAGHWAPEAIAFVTARGLFNGVSENAFGPDLGMTRGMLAVVLHNLESNPPAEFTSSFNDVADGAWYEQAIQWAAAKGIVSGYGNGDFGADDQITREQLAVMLYRYSGSPAVPNQHLDFTDADQVSAYADNALRWAVDEGILSGYGNGVLDPKGAATRAQVASMLMKFVESTAN